MLKGWLRAREAVLRFSKAQSMTEYALILAAVAVVVFAAYQALGTQISSTLSSATGDL